MCIPSHQSETTFHDRCFLSLSVLFQLEQSSDLWTVLFNFLSLRHHSSASNWISFIINPAIAIIYHSLYALITGLLRTSTEMISLVPCAHIILVTVCSFQVNRSELKFMVIFFSLTKLFCSLKICYTVFSIFIYTYLKLYTTFSVYLYMYLKAAHTQCVLAIVEADTFPDFDVM